MTPHIINSGGFRKDQDYLVWFSEIKQRYQSAQIKAAVKVNIEKLRFNWSLGRDLVKRKVEERWGAGVVNQLSLDLQDAFPNDKGFGSRNLWRMKQWYLYFSNEAFLTKLTQLGAVLQGAKYQELLNLSQTGSVLENDDFSIGSRSRALAASNRNNDFVQYG